MDNILENSPENDYFSNRSININSYFNYKLPKYYHEILPKNKEALILDIGCGLGQTLELITKLGYKNTFGIDIDERAIEVCRDRNLNVSRILDLKEFCKNENTKFDFIIMSHVLEHIPKDEIVNTLRYIRENLIASGGELVLFVPNAQSNTGCYWAYEDFTHHLLFTTGSIDYVLKSAGFKDIKFIDPLGISDSTFILKFVKFVLLQLYKANIKFWNKVTSSSYHKPSQQIYTYELKVIAKN